MKTVHRPEVWGSPIAAALLTALLCGHAAVHASETIVQFDVAERVLPADIAVERDILTGQSFTTPAAGHWDHITFNFVGYDTGQSIAEGHLYLYSQWYPNSNTIGGPTPVLVGVGTASAAGSVYTFDAEVTLHGHTQYFALADVHVGGANGVVQTRGVYEPVPLSRDPRQLESQPLPGDGIMNGRTGLSLSRRGPHDTPAVSWLMNMQADRAFHVAGVATVPEADAIGLMLAGVGVVGLAFRTRRFNKQAP
jgi:hypothetical protein